MNPTQNQDNYGPDTTPEPTRFGTVTPDGVFKLVRPEQPATDTATDFAGLLNDQDRFRAWVASAAGTASQPVTDPGEDDCFVVTVSGLRALGEVPDSTPEVLRGAACYLERYGWIQGAYYDGTSGVFTPPADLVGAVAMVCYGGPCEMPSQHFDDPGFLEFEAALLHLDRYTLVHDSRIAYDFNDAPGRRKQDVITVLRKAAATPACELIDALRVIDEQDTPLAAIAEAFTPGGIWAGEPEQACPSCGSTDLVERKFVKVKEGYGSCFCVDSWHNLCDRVGGDA